MWKKFDKLTGNIKTIVGLDAIGVYRNSICLPSVSKILVWDAAV